MPIQKSFEKMYALSLNLVLSKVQNCYAKDRLWKSAVREISLEVYARESRVPLDPPLNLPLLGSILGLKG